MAKSKKPADNIKIRNRSGMIKEMPRRDYEKREKNLNLDGWYSIEPKKAQELELGEPLEQESKGEESNSLT